MPRYACPFDEFGESWIEVPERWTGYHAQRDYEAQKKLDGRGFAPVYENFIRAMALLDDWFIPALSGNPDKWQAETLDLRLMAWVSQLTLGAYLLNFQVPKKAWLPLRNGQATETNEIPPGTSTETESTPG